MFVFVCVNVFAGVNVFVCVLCAYTMIVLRMLCALCVCVMYVVCDVCVLCIL